MKHTQGKMDVHVNAATEQAILKIGDEDIAFLNFQCHRGKNNHIEQVANAHRIADLWNSVDKATE